MSRDPKSSLALAGHSRSADTLTPVLTMVVITHEIGFAKEVGDRVLFFDGGLIVEEARPDVFFSDPQSERGKLFLSQIL
jgi:ABC-type polar amino acid transport system ATPase subunit